MRYVTYVLLVLSGLATALGVLYGLPRLGGHGVLAFALSALPGVLALLGLVTRRGFPRWAGAVSLVAFAVVGMKTAGDSEDLQNIMVCVFFGMFPALALLIRPHRPHPDAPG